MKIIDTYKWDRKEYFDFFSKYDDPFHGLVSEIDCTVAYHKAKLDNISFFSYYLHKAIIAINQIAVFKYRIVDDKVVLFDKIHAATTIGRKDGTFSFSFTEFDKVYATFSTALKNVIEQVNNSKGLGIATNTYRADVIHFSSIPWNSFTSITHARNLKGVDTVPKITFGKMFLKEKKYFMPIAINVHHGFADGIHISQFLELFQQLMNK